MAVERVVVVGGGGLMGSGISQVVAAAGFQVTIVEVDEATIERGLKRIERGLEKAGGRDGRGAGADQRLDGPRDGRRRRRPRDRERDRGDRGQGGRAAAARRRLPRRRDLRLEHLAVPDLEARRVHGEARPRDRQPLVQPAAADEADRGDPRASRPPTRPSRRRSPSRSATARRRSSAARTRPASSPRA